MLIVIAKSQISKLTWQNKRTLPGKQQSIFKSVTENVPNPIMHKVEGETSFKIIKEIDMHALANVESYESELGGALQG